MTILFFMRLFGPGKNKSVCVFRNPLEVTQGRTRLSMKVADFPVELLFFRILVVCCRRVFQKKETRHEKIVHQPNVQRLVHLFDRHAHPRDPLYRFRKILLPDGQRDRRFLGRFLGFAREMIVAFAGSGLEEVLPAVVKGSTCSGICNEGTFPPRPEELTLLERTPAKG
jgi:hypothetical protein